MAQGHAGMGETYSALIGPESDQKLIFADSQNWVADESVQIACDKGFVDLSDWQ